MGLYTNSDAYDRHWWEAYNKRAAASREELKDVELPNVDEMNLVEFMAYEVFCYELKWHLPIGEMSFDEMLVHKGVLSWPEINKLNSK